MASLKFFLIQTGVIVLYMTDFFSVYFILSQGNADVYGNYLLCHLLFCLYSSMK